MLCFAKNDDGILNELDRVLKNQSIYDTNKENKIDSLKLQLANPSLNLQQQFRLNNELGEVYQLFITDSAMKYLDRSMIVADRLRNDAMKDEVRINLAYVLSVSGLYKEALDVFDEIDRVNLPNQLLVDYYNCGRQIYGFLGSYSRNDSYIAKYHQKQYLYRDSLIDVLPTNSYEYKLYIAENGRAHV